MSLEEKVSTQGGKGCVGLLVCVIANEVKQSRECTRGIATPYRARDDTHFSKAAV